MELPILVNSRTTTQSTTTLNAIYLDLQHSDLVNRDLTSLGQAYRNALEGTSLEECLGTISLGLSAPAPASWADPITRRYLRFALANMPLLPLLLSLDSPSTYWFLLAQQGSGVALVGSGARIVPKQYEAFLARLEFLAMPAMAQIKPSSSTARRIADQRLLLRDGLLQFVQHESRLD